MQQLNLSSYFTSQWDNECLAPSIVLGFCFLVGIPGNVMVILAMLRCYDRDNFTLTLMLNLALTDILCLVTVPLWIGDLLSEWGLGDAGCKVLNTMVYCGVYGSVLTVTLMSIQRYVQVLFPHRWLRVRGCGEKLLLAAIWLLAVLQATPATVMTYAPQDRCGSCRWVYPSDAEKVVILLMQSLLGFVVPFSTLLAAYCFLYHKVTQSPFFRNRRLSRLVSSIVVTFFLFWSAVHVVNALEVSSVWLKPSHPQAAVALDGICDDARNVVRAVAFVNSCVNPCMYAYSWRNR